MARVQTQYNPGSTGIQRVAATPVQAVTASADMLQEDSATRLARSLGVLDVNRTGQVANRTLEAVDEQDRIKARTYANSLTVDELGKQIKSGQLLASETPVFNAAVQHIFGENTRSNFERDTFSKLSSGELKFTNTEEMDKYITEARNGYLEGQSQYAVAGFDKGWGRFREQAVGTLTKINDIEAVNRGVQEASDNLANVLLDVSGPGFTGTREEAAKTLMGRYEMLTSTQLLRDDARKEALSNLVTRVAASGNRPLVEQLLSSKLPNNGPSVNAMLGERQSVTLLNAADSQSDKDNRQRVDVELAPFLRAAHDGTLSDKQLEDWRKQNERYVSSSTIESLLRTNEASQLRTDKLNLQHANMMRADATIKEQSQLASTLVADRRGHEMQDFSVPTPDGTMKTVKGKDLVAAEVERRIAAQPDMPFDEQVRMYANNSVPNKKWTAELNAAYTNIGEVGVDAKGKPIGELLPASIEAIDRFALINQVSSTYARELAEGESKYQLMTNIQALREAGTDTNLAASLVNQSERNAGADSAKINAQVGTAITSITNPGVFTGRFWGEVLSGEWGDGEKNLQVVQGSVRSLAKAYMTSGVASTGEDAVKRAVEYYANPSVSTQINNTIYFNKDLPRVPDKQDQRFWFQRYMDNVVADHLKQQQINYSPSEVVLQPMLGGEPRYMLKLRGLPIGTEFLRKDVERWITETDKKDIADRLSQKQAPKAGSFVQDDTGGGAAMVFRKQAR